VREAKEHDSRRQVLADLFVSGGKGTANNR
jgi:hypothetical protein